MEAMRKTKQLSVQYFFVRLVRKCWPSTILLVSLKRKRIKSSHSFKNLRITVRQRETQPTSSTCLTHVNKTEEHLMNSYLTFAIRRELRNSVIRDRIVCGIDNDSVREQLLWDNNLSLEKAISAVRATETIKNQGKNLNNSPFKVGVLHMYKNKHHPKDKVKEQFKHTSRKSSKTKLCKRNGSNHALRQCPAFGQTCHKCQGSNHLAKMCCTKVFNPPKPKQCVHKVQQGESGDDSSMEELFLGEISTISDGNEILTSLKVNGKNVHFKMDTGAQCNVLPESIFNEINKKLKLNSTHTKLTACGGAWVPVKGKCSLNIERDGNKKTKAEFFVVQTSNTKPLIGLQTCRDLELISINQVNEVHESTTDILREYDDVFNGLGLVQGEYHIELRDDAKPTIDPARKVPLSLMPKLKETLDKMSKSGVISKVDGPTDWVNILVIVEKKDGTLRLCLDPKNLNKVIKREHYSAPTAETISNNLSGKKVFTVIDMSNCYWHKKLDKESSHLCAFNIPFGHYKFNRIPFGLCSASYVA